MKSLRKMKKITKKFEFQLKEELSKTTIEECGEEMTPTMRVIKKCTDFIDEFYHSPEDEYEIMYSSHIKEPNGSRRQHNLKIFLLCHSQLFE